METIVADRTQQQITGGNTVIWIRAKWNSTQCLQSALTRGWVIWIKKQEEWWKSRQTDKGELEQMIRKEHSRKAHGGKSKTAPLTLGESLGYRDQNFVTDTWQESSKQNQLQGEFGLRNKGKALFSEPETWSGPHLKPSFKGKRDAGPGNRQDLASLRLGHYPHNLY